MGVDYRDGVAILQIIIFVPAAATALYLCTKHGFTRASGWVLLVTFSLLRITGSILRFISHSSNIETEKNAITGEFVCNSVGLSPLNLMLIALLSRVSNFVTPRISPHFFRVIGLCSLAGLILGIIGGTNTHYGKGLSISINAETKSAILIFFVIYCLQLIILGFMTTKLKQIQAGERRLLLAVALSSPFLLVRYAYSLHYDFTQDFEYSSVFGNTTIYLCMDVLQEIAVVIIVLGFGLTLKQLPAPADDETVVGDNTEPKNENGETVEGQTAPSAPKPQRRKRKIQGGPILWLIFTIKDYIDSRKESKE